jgi:deoxyribonuclease V
VKDKVVAKKIETHKGSKPIFVSPGNLISLDTAVKITKKCVKEPHKLPEPLVKARRYLDKVRTEFK